MTDRELLQQALAALEKNSKHLPVDFDYHFDAIEAIRARLAETDNMTITHLINDTYQVIDFKDEGVLFQGTYVACSAYIES